MKIMRLWEVDIRSGASLAGLAILWVREDVKYGMLGSHLKGATNNICMMSGVPSCL